MFFKQKIHDQNIAENKMVRKPTSLVFKMQIPVYIEKSFLWKKERKRKGRRVWDKEAW
jgi:hypothetical protein